MWFAACRPIASLKCFQRALATSCLRGCQSVKQILAFKDVNKAIEIKGWVRALRKHKDVVFLDVSDGSAAAKVQVVVPADCVRPGLSYGAAVQVLGKLVASTHKGQEFEVHAEDITVLGPCDVKGYPFHTRKTYPPEYIRSFLHFRPRLAKEAAMLRIRSAALMAVHTAFQSQGFFHVHTPILTSNDCEGGGNVFTVKPINQQAAEKESGKNSEELFFGRLAFLTVSAQLHLEAVAMSLSKVYTVGPTFRAENCNTRRHVCEFCMVEAEEAFVTSLDTLLQRTEDVVKKVFTNLVNSSNQDVAVIMRDAPSGHLDTVQAAMEKPFVRMTYSECINVLQSARNEKSSLHNIEWGQDMGADHEEYLVKHCGNGGPLFVTHFPSALKPFYMKHSAHQSSTGECDGIAVTTHISPTKSQWRIQLGRLPLISASGGLLPQDNNDDDDDNVQDMWEVKERKQALQAAQKCFTVIGGHVVEGFDLLAPFGGELCGGSLREDDPTVLEERLQTLGITEAFPWYLDLRKYGSAPHGGFGLGFDRMLQYFFAVKNIRDVVTFPRWSHHCSM